MDDLTQLTIATRNRRRELDALMGEARATLLRGKEIETEIGTLSEDVNDYERVTGLLNSLGEERQLAAQRTIEELVTRGLQTIFDESLSFHIVQTVKGRAAFVEFLVHTTLENGQVVETPVMDARGGGLAATIGFMLRVVVMLLRSRDTNEENVLILDETFAHVSEEYLPALGEFLRELVDKTGIQIVMVTHQPVFEDYADKVYRFSQTNGATQVRERA